LANHLAEKTEFPSDEMRDLAKVAEYFDIVAGRVPLDRELHRIFNRDYPITSLHNFLADISAPMLLVTTNYDDLIERAFKDRHKGFDLVVHTTDARLGDRLLWWKADATEPHEINPNRLDIDIEATTVIYKIHGTVDRRDSQRDQYVITEDDYIEVVARMTKNKAIPAIFAEAFQIRHFLFLGYGLRDWNLRVVLNRMEKDVRRRKGIRSWAIQHKPSPMEQRFWQERGVEVYDMLIDEFVRELTAH
jgi:hypothetical protein